MNLSTYSLDPDHVVVIEGDVAAGDGAALTSAINDALASGEPQPSAPDSTSRGGSDVILDARQAHSFDARALPALVVSRSRAKWLRHRIVVVDDGALKAALRSSGLHAQFPVFAAPEQARQGLATLRQVRGLAAINGA